MIRVFTADPRRGPNPVQIIEFPTGHRCRLPDLAAALGRSPSTINHRLHMPDMTPERLLGTSRGRRIVPNPDWLQVVEACAVEQVEPMPAQPTHGWGWAS